MIKKILIIGPDYYGYNDSIAKAFSKHGCETDVFSYNEKLILPYHLLDKMGLLKGVDNLGTTKLINDTILKKYRSFLPDTVLIIKATLLYDETLIQLKNSVLLLWMLDSVFRFPDVIRKLHYFDRLFMFEKTDVIELDKRGVSSTFLPIGYDDDVYYPKQNSVKDIDIFFIGSLYDDRLDVLYKIMDRFKEMNLKFFGKRVFTKNRPFKYFGNRKIFPNRNLSPKEINEFYNSSKICLNIHKSQSVNGVNPRFFEIAGSGAIQVVNSNLQINELFPDNEILVYDDIEQLTTIISHVINNWPQNSALTHKIWDYTRDNHTFKKRAEFILKNI